MQLFVTARAHGQAGNQAGNVKSDLLFNGTVTFIN
jgi:hypothetical protein